MSRYPYAQFCAVKFAPPAMRARVADVNWRRFGLKMKLRRKIIAAETNARRFGDRRSALAQRRATYWWGVVDKWCAKYAAL
jgi:hypothetical protein